MNINKNTILAGAVAAAADSLSAKQRAMLDKIRMDGRHRWPDLKPGSPTHNALVALADAGLITLSQSETVAEGHVSIVAAIA